MRKSILLVVIAFFLSFGIASAQQSIKLGWIGPLTGPSAESGIADKQGCIMAMDEWNKSGGVELKKLNKKLPVEIIFEDAQSKPEIGVSLGEKLILRDKVNVLLGDAFNSSVTMAVMELAPKYRMPVMSIESVSAEISKKIKDNPEKYKYFWKGMYGSTAYGKNIFSLYQFLIENNMLNPKNKSIVMIIEDTDYGRSNAAEIKDRFEKIGWNIASIEIVPLGYTDFYPQLNKIAALDPDILVSCFVSVSSGVAFVKQFQEVGIKASHTALYYPSRPEFLDQAGEYANYLLWIQSVYFDPKNNKAQGEFVKKYEDRFSTKANLDAALGYDGINNVLDSLKRAGSLEPDDIISAIAKLDRDGIIGRYVFDTENHEIKDGPDYIALPGAQIINKENIYIWPKKFANGEYKDQPWMK